MEGDSTAESFGSSSFPVEMLGPKARMASILVSPRSLQNLDFPEFILIYFIHSFFFYRHRSQSMTLQTN